MKFVACLGSHIMAYEYDVEAEQTCVIHGVIDVFQLKLIHWFLN